MKNKASKVTTIVLFVVAGILFGYAIWAISNCAKYIGEMINSGQLAFSGNEYDIVSFYMGNCAQYIVFALLLTASGISLSKKAPVTEIPIIASPFPKEETDELDDWFEPDENDSSNRKEGD